ncbi:FAD-dependent oxidoreductase [Mycolicibacterium thermoresistibile]
MAMAYAGAEPKAPWDRLVDVVVVGTGVAGAAAAAAASRAGASVMMCEKADAPGGTTARSGGGMWIPNNFHLRAQGIVDDRDRMLRYMARSAHPTKYRPQDPAFGLTDREFELIECFFDHASEVVDELTPAPVRIRTSGAARRSSSRRGRREPGRTPRATRCIPSLRRVRTIA